MPFAPLMAILLLAPSPPMLFMGEEFAAETPFLFFCDFEKDLAAAVTRDGEMSLLALRLSEIQPRASGSRIQSDAGTFEASRLDWSTIEQPQPSRMA